MVAITFGPTDYTKQTWVSYGFLCLTYLNVGASCAAPWRSHFGRWWWLLALAGISAFSPVQYQVFLWLNPDQVTCLLFFLTAGILVWMTRWPLWLAVLSRGRLCRVSHAELRHRPFGVDCSDARGGMERTPQRSASSHLGGRRVAGCFCHQQWGSILI